MNVRLLSYNIRYGGVGRVAALAAVVRRSDPDLVVLQEATHPNVVKELASALGMKHWASTPGHSVGFMSRLEIAHHAWHRPRPCRRALLELVPAGTESRIFGVHLTAVHSNWTERRRVRELKALLTSIEHHQHGFHVMAGDFNTLAPGETFDLRLLPARLRLVSLIGGGTIRWQTIQVMLDAHYVDGYRILHPDDRGFTFPASRPHLRLDYVFVPEAARERLRGCRVVDGGDAAAASDHLPVLAELEL